MLSDELVLQIRESLLRGESRNSIAKSLKVSRRVVQSVAAGKRSLRTERAAVKQRQWQPPDEAEPWRCPSCGRVIALSYCLRCHLKASGIVRQLSPINDDDEVDFSLNLRPQERERYLIIFNRKEEEFKNGFQDCSEEGQ